MDVCQLTDKYVDEIVEIENSCFSVPWSKNLIEKEFLNPAAFYVGVLEKEKLVGYGGYWKILDEGHITNLAVLEQYRNQGLGELLVTTLVKKAKEQGIIAMTLEVRESNLPAIGLYKKMGFISLGIRKGYYADNNENALIMWNNNITAIYL